MNVSMLEATERTRRNRYRRLYGITVEQYDALLAEQNGVCALCDRPCGTGQRLAVDHDHHTGKVRGLVCLACNTSMGKLGLDDPGRVARLVIHLGGGR